MRSSSDSTKATTEPLGASSLEDWPSFLENSQTEPTRPLFHAFLLVCITAYLRTPRGLAALSILLAALMVALVFASTLLISWATQPRVSALSSTAVSLSESDLGIWTARRLFCYRDQPCDAWSPYSEDDPSNLRYVIQPEVVLIRI